MAKIFEHDGETYTPKQWIFAHHYAETLNGVDSAREAEYRGSYSVLGVVAHDNLKKHKIKKLVRHLIGERLMPLEEVLIRIEEQATASLGDYIQFDDDGNISINTKLVKTAGHLIRKVNVRKKQIENEEKGYVSEEEAISIELYSAQKALELLGKYYKLFVERLELEGDIGIKGYINVSPDDWDNGDKKA